MLATLYPWVKAVHVISVIAWMGAQLALFLILALHKGLLPGSGQVAMLVEVERKLIRRMLNPGIIVAFICGGAMLVMLAKLGGGLLAWLMIKLGLVVLLSALHGLLLRECRLIAATGSRNGVLVGQVSLWINLVLLVGVVALVIIKPDLRTGFWI